MLNSVSKIDAPRQKGILLNQRLSPVLMNSDVGFDLWHSYMKTWHAKGLDHVQFNVISTEDMKAAQKEPEKYTDMIVRVAGYSARFIDLARYSQGYHHCPYRSMKVCLAISFNQGDKDSSAPC